MEICQLGQLLGKGVRRDCAHSPLMPSVSKTKLKPGQMIQLSGHVCQMTGYPIVEATDVHALMFGIVDPFLEKAVEPGEYFYVMVKPNTVTSVRHLWTHPHLCLKEM